MPCPKKSFVISFSGLALSLILVSCGGGGENENSSGGGVSSSTPTVPGGNTPTTAIGAPTILVQPHSLTVSVGTMARMSVTASGEKLQYQWSRNGVPVFGATSPSYTLDVAALGDDASEWTVTVSNAIGQLVSKSAALTVWSSPGLALLAGGLSPFNIDAQGSRAGFAAIRGLALAPDGGVYVSDGTALRKISADGIVSTVAGSLQEGGYRDGSAAMARMGSTDCSNGAVTIYDCLSIASNAVGDVYVGDVSNSLIRKVTVKGDVLTVSGFPAASVYSMNLDQQDNLYFITGYPSFENIGPYQFWLIQMNSVAYTDIKSSFLNGITLSWLGYRNYNQFARDESGNIFIVPTRAFGELQTESDAGLAIYKRTPDGRVTKFAGSDKEIGAIDGEGTYARFGGPVATAYGRKTMGKIVADSSGNIYAADINNQAIRKITPRGQVSTVVGQLNSTQVGVQLGVLPGQLKQPWALVIDSKKGRLYIGDWFNNGPAVLVAQLEPE